MATFDAEELVLPDPLAEALSYDSPPMIEVSPVSSDIGPQYLISAWNLTTVGYETWISTDPNSAAPSGNPTGERIVKEL